MMKKIVSLVLTALFISSSAAAQMVVSLTRPISQADTPQLYSIALVRLALEKTREQYGDFRIETTPITTRPRSLANLASNVYPNALIETGYDAKLTASGKLDFINFPMDGGIVGYRVCFVNPAIKGKFDKNVSLEQLRKYNFGQGANWVDSTILRYNGFTVAEFSSYEGLFKMVGAGRIDFFCRGANEILSEQNIFKNLKNLVVDEQLVLVYPLPRFFYFNSKNTLVNERVTAGLKMAYADGSFEKLWREYYQADIDALKLNQRTVFHLDNPLLKDLPADYKHYVIDPFPKNK